MKDILGTLEESRPGITNEILKLEKVNRLASNGRFLEIKMNESISSIQLERQPANAKIQNLKTNPLLISFMGAPMIEKVITQLEK
jgi:hypothetical protein